MFFCYLFTERKQIATSEELVLNLVAAITNLSFCYTTDNVILKNQLKISTRMRFSSSVYFSPSCSPSLSFSLSLPSLFSYYSSVVLMPLLVFKNEEAIVESVRAYANFSRDAQVRRVMTEKKRTWKRAEGGRRKEEGGRRDGEGEQREERERSEKQKYRTE